jgi:hypothetical protein
MLVKKSKATVFFSCRLIPALKPLQINQNGSFNRDDGDEDHGWTEPLQSCWEPKPAAVGEPMCGCRSDRRGM